MGIWTSLLVAPREPRLLPRDQFGNLLHDLLRNNIVQMPCMLLICGSLTAHLSAVPFKWQYQFVQTIEVNEVQITVPGNFPPGTKLDYGDIIHYCGESMEELLQVLSLAPYGIRDMCAWFHGLNLEVNSSGNYADGIVYALLELDKLIFYETNGWSGEVLKLTEEEYECHF